MIHEDSGVQKARDRGARGVVRVGPLSSAGVVLVQTSSGRVSLHQAYVPLDDS